MSRGRENQANQVRTPRDAQLVVNAFEVGAYRTLSPAGLESDVRHGHTLRQLHRHAALGRREAKRRTDQPRIDARRHFRKVNQHQCSQIQGAGFLLANGHGKNVQRQSRHNGRVPDGQ